MSLKFLDSGTDAFVGSTCIAYGSVTMPLIAADYLADLYWKTGSGRRCRGVRPDAGQAELRPGDDP